MKKRLLTAVLAAVMILSFCWVSPVQANAITQLSASEECIDLIKTMEGFHAIPYWDFAQWTVGFGTACPDEKLQQYLQEGIPVDEAEKLLQDAMVYFNREVNKFMTRYGVQLNQHQFDALFSLSYNIGVAWMYESGNRLVQALVKGASNNELIYLMGLRSKAGGQFQQGLFKRRMMEADLYLNGRYNTKMPADYASVTYDAGNGRCEATMQGYDLHQPAEPLAVPTYEGYKFLGWYTQAEGGYRITQLDTSTDGMTLYAHWEKVGIADNVQTNPVENILVTVRASMLNVRVGPGTSYSVASCIPAGTQLMITAVTIRNGTTWGKCSLGWISLAHTDYRAPSGSGDDDSQTSNVSLPADATVIGASGIKIHTGPHISYPQRGTLSQGAKVTVLELKEFYGQVWARIEAGWIKLDKNLMLHDSTVLAHSFVATVTNSYLNVRSGPGTEYSLAGSLAQGDRVEILAIDEVDGMLWGRCYKGWISLTYTDFNKTQLERYKNHQFGAWYSEGTASCAQQTQERRDCAECDHFETRTSEKVQHSFGDWYEVTAPTYADEGLQRRDCSLCGASETAPIPCLPQPNITIYGTVTGCDVLNVRAAAGSGNAWVGTLKRGDKVEILEQVTVNGKVWGRCEKGWFCITGYVTLNVVEEEEDNRQLMTVTAFQLNIRAGAGSSYKVVGVLNQGDQVEILETVMVDGTTWVRIDRGWVSTKYLK